MTTASHKFAIPNTALDAQCHEARVLVPSWESLIEALGVTDADVQDLRRLADRNSWTSGVINHIECIEAALRILFHATYSSEADTDVDDTLVLYIVTLLYDFALFLLEAGEKMILPAPKESSSYTGDSIIIHKNSTTNNVKDWYTFAFRNRLLKGNDLISGHVARLLAVYILSDQQISIDTIEVFYDWIYLSLQVYLEREQRTFLALSILSHIFRSPLKRIEFFKYSVSREVIQCLCSSLLLSNNIQIQYQALFSLWLLSFEPEVALSMQSTHNIITLLVDVCKAAIKDKIVRICIAIWRNFLALCPKIAVPIMIGAKVHAYLESLNFGKLADEEVHSDVAALREALSLALQNLNSFDEYASEVKSGKLQWSPPHKSELFWKENSARLLSNDCEILRLLTNMLDPSSSDTLVLAVAANDIGMLSSHNPTARKHLETLGTKPRIMALIYHDDPEVRFQALSAMQKYMKNMWHT
jgi:V-type H+-transporting ATPase subunit H